MIWFLLYLLAGAANYAQSVARGNALLFLRPKRRNGDSRIAGIAEAAFFVFAWPIQLLFFMLLGIHLATATILRRVMMQ